MNEFRLVSKFKPTGDQPQAIEKLVEGIKKGKRFQTLLGVTGSGKTFTLACVIEKVKKPTLVISHNKTLASQLYAEFKEFFPYNSVEYFVSYYDYYQPESYIPETDTYIEKDASINERLDRLRLSATSSLVSRRDVIVVASVSCIYNLGSPQDYQELILYIQKNQTTSLDSFLSRLVSLQYERNDFDFKRGVFRVRGDSVDIFPTYRERALKVEFFGDTIDKIFEFDPLTGKKIAELDKVGIYPSKHFIIPQDKIEGALKTIQWELEDRLTYFKKIGKILEAERLRTRTLYDMEMLKECGYCHGIENYSRHLSGRPPGSRPYCLLDYFPKDFLVIIDESHVTIPQLRGMYEGDRSRKETLVEYGFRLPSCLDNRPLRFDEFMELINQVIFVSATPSSFEIELSGGVVVEQLIRPTGLVDPEIEVRPTKNQIDDLIGEIRKRVSYGERTLVTTLTKRMAEELASFLREEGIKVTYIHSEIDTLQRAKILKDLRSKKFDCLVGINLLREGLDLPEVSLVAILDADREGFLRSTTSLIQIAGRCARNINGKVLMYADTVTNSMRKAIQESERRRKIQLEYNRKYNITPKTIEKAIREGIEVYLSEEERLKERLDFKEKELEIMEAIAYLEREMFIAAKNLQFEKAAQIRDRIGELKEAFKKSK
ncbi:MAG: excinuclease ABC subunit B [Candidatus Omnitrophota bacterium]|nr:MAG: excinuclease ABC subunit B [Candidatus Omnitrophota bacterium]HDN86238.1 excinuclease ABC subunit UvrB [Candidatus Omnitrophota bacterium]